MWVTIKSPNKDALLAKFEGLDKERLDAWDRYAISEEMNAFASYVSDTWLQGRAMKARTNETRNSVLPWVRKKTGGVAVRPGVGIWGSLNYLARYVGTEREFMLPAFDEWGKKRIRKAVRDNMQKMLDKWSNSDDGKH